MKSINDITPSKEQQSCIDYRSGDLLINGIPGAGKSIVLLKRALSLYNQSTDGEKNVILLTTFNNTLNDYTKDIFQQANVDSERMTIMTMDSYCSRIYGKIFRERFDWADDDKENRDFVSQALQNHYKTHGTEHRFYQVEEDFWLQEFHWIKQKNIRTLQTYLDSDRVGRGGKVRITREERKIVYEFFQEYCYLLKQTGKKEMEDIYLGLLNRVNDLKPYKFKFVMVDEAQDLSYAKLKVAKLLAYDSITIAADRAQKIYNTGFTWKELGIDIHANSSKTLHKTFRSTRQIVELAESLSEINRALDNDKNEYTEPEYPSILGSDYPFIVKCPNAATEKQFLINIIKKSINSVTIGLLCRTYSEKQELIEYLASNHVSFEEIKKGGNWSLRSPGLKVTTLHSSKGLEFDVVIIPCFNSTFFPPIADMMKADEEQIVELQAKERSLLYVGMTRAKSTLYLTFSGEESSFLSELNPLFYNYYAASGEKIEKPTRVIPTVSKVTENINADENGQEELDLDGSEIVIKMNDTITAHLKGEKKERTLYGSRAADPANWKFIGKRIGDQVTVCSVVYVVDSINGKRIDYKAAAQESKSVDSPSSKGKTWDTILSRLFGDSKTFAIDAKTKNIPIPTTIDSSLMGVDGSIIAEAELAWEQLKIVFLRNDQSEFKGIWEKEGWKVITSANDF